jgi:hypothetical protein
MALYFKARFAGDAGVSTVSKRASFEPMAVIRAEDPHGPEAVEQSIDASSEEPMLAYAHELEECCDTWLAEHIGCVGCPLADEGNECMVRDPQKWRC